MGYMRHHAIIVSACNEGSVDKAYAEAVRIFGEAVSPIGPEVTNGYRSFFVGPDGSKEFTWPESKAGDERRSTFKVWLRSPPTGVFLDWAEIQYGDDDHDNRLTAASGGVTGPSR